MTIACRQLIQHWAQKDARRVAIYTATEHITYLDLQVRISSLVAELRSHQIQPGTQIALVFTNSPDFIIWLFAILELGAVACPLDPQLSTSETQALLAAGDIDLYCSSQGEKVEDWTPLNEPENVDGQLWRRNDRLSGSKPVLDEQVVLRQFTSGSTGHARHILRTERQLTEDYRHFCEHLALTGGERFLGVAPFYHAFGALGLFACLSLGASIMPIRRFMPGEVLEMANRLQPTVFLATPPMIELLGRCFLRQDEGGAFDSLKYCICSTGKLKQEASDVFTERFRQPVSVLYGSSETLSATIDLDGSFMENRVGNAFPGVSLKVFDDSGKELDIGKVGRIGIKSPASCTSYAVSDEPLPMIGRFTLPGDKGYLDQAGQLYVLGRDDCIDVGGYKVDRIEVQEAIRHKLPVNDIAVLPYLRAGQPALRAIVEADPDEVTVAMLYSACKKHLAAYKIPARIDVCKEIPRDANGKIKLGQLEALMASIDES